ncbi:MAG TPA: bifunctional DedA family/phosphatase PAP2 family protein [Thermoleophilaceae bacterium]|nr:bifunctional DedA family/phosphatase PAP2 family protein [Thermoleophilaceae bacterium]
MSPGHIVAAVVAVAVAVLAYRRRERLSGEFKVIAGVVVIALAVYASGVLSSLPSFDKIIEDVAKALGKGTYVLVGAMAFLETGAFIGFIAPGEFTVILGGVIAGQGTISIIPLIGIVWGCAIAGDSLSFLIGHRVGRQFLLKHGPKIRITEERFHQVEDYFDRHGGKTIVIGRFIGFVRPLAPFIAGSSRMRYARFLPYSVVGTGLWGTTFCLLGYIFWRSFHKVSKIAGQASIAFGVLVVVIGGIWYAQRRLRNPEERERLERWMNRRRSTRWAWQWLIRPVARVAWPQVRFLWGRLTPGRLGLEFTTAIAVAVGGAYGFIVFASALHDEPKRIFPLDNTAFDIADRLRTAWLTDLAKVVSAAGSLTFVLVLVVIGSIALIIRRRPLELFTLAGGFGLTVLAVHLAKAGIDRPRPAGELVDTVGSAYPSGHAAYATAYIAIAVIGTRVVGGIASRTGLVFAALVVALVIGASRIYLRAHYLSDVVGALGLGLAIFASCASLALVVGFIRQNARR